MHIMQNHYRLTEDFLCLFNKHLSFHFSIFKVGRVYDIEMGSNKDTFPTQAFFIISEYNFAKILDMLEYWHKVHVKNMFVS